MPGWLVLAVTAFLVALLGGMLAQTPGRMCS